jgi:hypothetical protein
MKPYFPKDDYQPENADNFAKYIDELVMDRKVHLDTLREWVGYWPTSFKSAVWGKISPHTRAVLKLMQG